MLTVSISAHADIYQLSTNRRDTRPCSAGGIWKRNAYCSTHELSSSFIERAFSGFPSELVGNLEVETSTGN
jgi:hypothetical protein